MKQLALFDQNPQIAEFAPEPPRNPDPPPKRSLSDSDSDDVDGIFQTVGNLPASTLRDKLMARRRREQRQRDRDE